MDARGLGPGELWTLNWRELARVQGFPNDYVFPTALGRTEKMIGQAISVDVGRALLTAVCDEFARELVESRLDGP